MKVEQLSYGILAGGKSQRMGIDKAVLKLQNETFLHVLIDEFWQHGPLMISVRDQAQGEALGVPCLTDQNHNIGPLEGICNLLRWCPTDYLFICACDMPFLKFEMAEYLAAFLAAGDECCIAWDGERAHPLCAIYAKRTLNLAEQVIGEGRYNLMRLVDRCKTTMVDIRKCERLLAGIQNINTKEDYQRWVGSESEL